MNKDLKKQLKQLKKTFNEDALLITQIADSLKLYHYSANMYKSLRTLRSQGTLSRAELLEGACKADKLGRVGYYADHISFFFDRVPLDMVGSIYGKDHRVWFPGNKLVEYVVTARALGDFKYEIVESPEETALRYDESVSDEEYEVKIRELTYRLGYNGAGVLALAKAVKPLLGSTRRNFENAPSYPDWNKHKTKYAANVPHLMLYPSKGEIAYESATLVHVS